MFREMFNIINPVSYSQSLYESQHSEKVICYDNKSSIINKTIYFLNMYIYPVVLSIEWGRLTKPLHQLLSLTFPLHSFFPSPLPPYMCEERLNNYKAKMKEVWARSVQAPSTLENILINLRGPQLAYSEEEEEQEKEKSRVVRLADGIKLSKKLRTKSGNEKFVKFDTHVIKFSDT